MLNQPTSSPMMKRIFGCLPLDAAGVCCACATCGALDVMADAASAVPESKTLRRFTPSRGFCVSSGSLSLEFITLLLFERRIGIRDDWLKCPLPPRAGQRDGNAGNNWARKGASHL